jgi:hypothetical protein
MSEIRVPVLVVGGGGAGLSASIFLSSHQRDSDVIGSLMWPSHGLDINRIDSLTTVLGFRGAAPWSGYPSTIAWSVSIANRRQEALDTTCRGQQRPRRLMPPASAA